MKVAFINPTLGGHLTRGTGVYAKRLSEALEKYTDTSVEFTEVDSIPRDADLIHFPYFDPFFLTLPLANSSKTIVTVHDLIPIKFAQEFPRGIRGELKWQIQKAILSTKKSIITDSQTSKRDILKFTGIASSKIHVVSLAPGDVFLRRKTNQDKKRLRDKLGLPDKFALYVGDVNWNKNVPSIIKATKSLNIPLILVSKPLIFRHELSYNPWKESILLSQQELTSYPDAKVLVSLSEEELSTLYQLATVFVFPSHYEGFGLPVVEAFASGCPVVTSNGGSLSEIAGDAARIVDPNSISDIAAGIKEVFENNSLRTELIKRGEARVKLYSWKKTALATFKVYQQLLTSI